MPDTPTPENVLALALHAALRSPKAMAAFGAEARAALLGAGYEIVRSEDRADEQIVREVLDGDLYVSSGRSGDRHQWVRVADGDQDRNGRGRTTWAALVAACREVSS